MTHKRKIMKALKSADISQDDWHCDIIENCQDRYAAGYLSAQIGFTNGNINEDSEEFRENLIQVCTYDIWNTEVKS